MIIKFPDYEDIQTYTPQEVAKMLVDICYLDLDEDERIGEVRLECGCDLEIDIDKVLDGEPRYTDRTETYTISDLTDAFSIADYLAWAKDENDNDILFCV